MKTLKTADKVIAIDLFRLNKELKEDLDEILDEAMKDRFLEGNEDLLRPDVKRRAIIYLATGKVIGFFSPYKTSMKGEKHWRAGAVYLQPQYRGRGIMEYVLGEFFSSHYPGLVWIDDSNTRSINLFTKLGFEKDKPRSHEGNEGHWYVLPRKSAAMEFLNLSFSW